MLQVKVKIGPFGIKAMHFHWNLLRKNLETKLPEIVGSPAQKTLVIEGPNFEGLTHVAGINSNAR